MAAGVNLYEQHADAALAIVSILEQRANVSGGTTAQVVLYEQHADSGGGSTALVRIMRQQATYQGGIDPPSGIAHADITHNWTPYTPFTSLAGDTNWH